MLANVTLSIERGEFVSIVGAMGSGKSTLLNIVAGLCAPDEGTVTVDGELTRDIRRDAALVFQNYSLLPWFSALENVRLAVNAAFPNQSRQEQLARARRSLERVGLTNAEHRRPGQLSGGMRQRVAIARAFAIEPEILFLDEPFGALDALTRETLQQELAQLCCDGRRVTTLMITNSVEEALLLSDRIVPMTRGPRATLGSPIAVDLPRPRTKALLTHDQDARRVRAAVVAALTSGTSRRAGNRRHPVAPLSSATQPRRGGRQAMIPPLELTGLTKVFATPSGPYVAVKDVNAKIERGEFVCILGHSGCGKSTVLSMMAGLEQATYGGVVIDGKEVREPGLDRAVVFQAPCLLPWLTARENVQLTRTRGRPCPQRGRLTTSTLWALPTPPTSTRRRCRWAPNNACRWPARWRSIRSSSSSTNHSPSSTR